MRHAALLGAAIATSLSLGACTTDRYASNDNRLERAAVGAAIGGAVGAGVGAVAKGVSPIEGAAVGAAVGGVAGAATGSDHRWYRDTRGYCFYVNEYGERIYDYDRRC